MQTDKKLPEAIKNDWESSRYSFDRMYGIVKAIVKKTSPNDAGEDAGDTPPTPGSLEYWAEEKRKAELLFETIRFKADTVSYLQQKFGGSTNGQTPEFQKLINDMQAQLDSLRGFRKQAEETAATLIKAPEIDELILQTEEMLKKCIETGSASPESASGLSEAREPAPEETKEKSDGGST